MERCKTILVVGASIDGKISPGRGLSSKKFGGQVPGKVSLELHKLRSNVDGIMVSSSTVLSDNPSLTVRSVNLRKKPYRIVIDRLGKIPQNSKILNDEADTIILTSREGKSKFKKAFCKAQIIICAAGREGLDLKDAFRKLKKLGINKILIEGGGTLNHGLFSSGIIDRMIVFIFPFIVGGKDTPTIVDGEKSFSDSLKQMKLKNVKQMGGCLISLYEPK